MQNRSQSFPQSARPLLARGSQKSHWPSYLATAVVSGLATAFVYRNFLEGEKKVMHDITTDYGVDAPEFTNTINNIIGPPLLKGNKVTILQNGKEIFPAMLQAIRSAQHSITFENFVFTQGKLTAAFVDALEERARAGIKIHFLQDAMGCNCLHGEEMHRLRAAGVEVEIFRFFHLRMNERTHRKLLIIDGHIGFIGGAGISDDWLGDADKPNRWRETQYQVEGPVVAQMQQAFLDNWIQTRGRVLHGNHYFPTIKENGPLSCQVFQSSAAEGADCARLMLLFSIAAARKSIRIATAYFVPDSLIVRTLVQARERGISVEIMTTGPHIDRTIVRWVGRSLWEPLLKAGVKFYEYSPCRFHCKYLVIDGKWTSVGSSNIDDRSLRLNEEANLNVMDADFGAAHMAIFEQDKHHCELITLEKWHQRSLREKLIANTCNLFKSQM